MLIQTYFKPRNGLPNPKGHLLLSIPSQAIALANSECTRFNISLSKIFGQIDDARKFFNTKLKNTKIFICKKFLNYGNKNHVKQFSYNIVCGKTVLQDTFCMKIN